MKIDGKPYRTIWLNTDGKSVEIIDQTKLPFRFETVTLRTLDDAARAISTMQVRGAPLIGATAAYGVALWAPRRPVRRGARPRLRDACRHQSHRHQSPLGARRDAEGRAQPAARQARRRRLRPRRRRSATRTSRPTARSASMGSASSARMPRRRRASASTSSPIAMPAGSLASIGARRSRRSIAPMTRASPSMSGWTRRGRAIRAHRSRPSSLARMACRIR